MSITGLLKSIFIYLSLLIIGLFILLTWLSINDRAVDYDVSQAGLTIPTFSEQTLPFIPTYDETKTLPFTAGAIIDVDGDGIEEIFIGGGMEQNDAFFRFKDGKFHDITAETKWRKQTPDDTFGAVSMDLDKDGDTDMIIARQSGVWQYTNQGGTFKEKKLDLDLDPKTVPLSVALADLNRDGLFDMYVSGYIARKHVEGETIFNQEYGGRSALYINTGKGFRNITKEAGLEYQHNTFQAIFIDVDNDHLEDLVVAHDTGQVRTWKNQGNLKFSNMPNPTSDYFSYPMGIAVTDLNNDDLVDFFFSNVGSTTPDAIVRGDLREEQVLNKKWIMFENQGQFTFNDTAPERKLADYEFSWGAIFEDFNLDGKDDLVVSENYIGFPTHAVPFWRLDGRFLLQTPTGEFSEASHQAGIQNRLFGISPLTADFNGDGAPDLVHVNLVGEQKVFLSDQPTNKFLKVKLPDMVESIGAKVAVTLEDGTVLKQNFIVGEGLCSDQSHTMIFGLEQQEVTAVQVDYLNGIRAETTEVSSNDTLIFPSINIAAVAQ
ncbi:CRTAC1 family protein [Marinomonas agarivorans]|nr:CRTAC1 family protein [Marinomonas agarivorans]